MRVCVVGGDDRLRLLAELLYHKGYDVHTWGHGIEDQPEVIHEAQAVILPIPRAANEGMILAPFSNRPIRVNRVVELIPEKAWVMAGVLDEELTHAASQKDWRLLLPGLDPSYEEKNAMPSAEGAIFAAMEKADHTLCGSHCLIIGPGRIGKELARMLLGLGARVTIAARREEALHEAAKMGCITIPMKELPDAAKTTDVLFNTAPSPVAGDEVLAALPAHALAIDLASAPYGIDLNAAKRCGIQAWREGGIPGRYAPRTAAAILLQYFEAHTRSDSK